jgi:3-oxoacyl-[acyl-carrier-protein] synthase II
MSAGAKRRVVITGIGLLTGAGNDPKTVWRSLAAGSCRGTRPIDRFEVGNLPTRIAAQVREFDPERLFGARQCQDMDRVTQMALYAAQEAMGDAGLRGWIDRYRLAVTFGTGMGGIGTIWRAAELAVSSATRRLPPLTIPVAMHNASAHQIARHIGAHGPNLTCSTACSSGSVALGAALRMVQRGEADAALVCGADAPIVPLPFRAWCALRAMSTWNEPPETAFRPFDMTRNGFVLGEGAGAVVCEEIESARERGARIYGEVLGFGSTCDAGALTAPSAEHQAEAIRVALDDAAIRPRDLGFVIAHATATRLNDLTEAEALRRALGVAAEFVPVAAYKPIFGHTMGACGVVEFIAGLMSVNRGWLNPTPNLTSPDPDCALRHVDACGMPPPGSVFISHAFGFGGNNAVLAARGGAGAP